uniref:RNB domain-containing protein n=1 Tax=Arcella intermedia TaxID=1963864 RepID=A0A6B2KYC4_9EUKA
MKADGKEVKVNRYSIGFRWPFDYQQEDSSQETQYYIQKITSLQEQVPHIIDQIFQNISIIDIWKNFEEKEPSKLIFASHVAEYLLSSFPEKLGHYQGSTLFQYACHTILYTNNIFFSSQSTSGFVCQSHDYVQLRIDRAREEQEEEEARALFIQKLKKQLQLKRTNGSEDDTQLFSEHFDVNFFKMIKNYALSSKETPRSSEISDKFLIPLGYGPKPHDAFELLVDLGLYSKNDNVHVLRWERNINYGYPESENEAENLIKDPPVDVFTKSRVLFEHPAFCWTNSSGELRNFAFTIDRNNDGDSVLYIHIADITRYVKFSSPLDKIAQERAGTIYLPERTYPMFPEAINSQVSFSETSQTSPQKYKALTISLTVNRRGKIDKYSITPSTINNIHSASFDEIDTVLLDLPDDRLTPRALRFKSLFFDRLVQMEEMAEGRKKYRVRAGARSIHLPQVKVRVKLIEDDNFIVKVGSGGHGGVNARGIANEVELLAGEIVSDYFTKSSTSGVFKSMPPIPLTLDFEASNDPLEDRIRQEALDKLKKKDYNANSIIKIRQQLRHLPTEATDFTRAPHSLHGLQGYTPILSPLNSYIDFINLTQLTYTLALEDWKKYHSEDWTEDEDEEKPTGPPVDSFGVHDLAEVVPKVEVKLNEVKILRTNSEKFWILHAMKQESKSSKVLYKSIVLTSKDDRNETLILILKYHLEVKTTIHRKLVKGQEIYVAVEHIDPFYDRIVLKDVPDFKPSTTLRKPKRKTKDDEDEEETEE